MKLTNTIARTLNLAVTVAVLAVWSISVQAQCCAGKLALAVAPSVEKVTPQTTCPVMGGKVNPDQYVDVKGFRVYVCCPGCVAKIKAAPDKYLAKIKANGETAEKAPVLLCSGCGEIKGTDKCCNKDAEKCGKCGLIKGSPGCCKITKGGKPVALCAKCGEIKGTDKCCK